MIIVHCPHCSGGFDLIQAWQDEDARRFTALITSLPPKVIKPCFIYLTHCFKPAKQALRWSKLLKLLQELVPMIKDVQVKRNGTTYCVPLDSWVAKLQELVESPPPNLVLPLKSHAYLLTILANQAEQFAGKAESKTEADKRAGVRAKPVDGEASLSFAELAALAAQKQQKHGDLPAPTQTKSTKEFKPLSDTVKSSLKDALSLGVNTKLPLTIEEKEERKATMLAQVKALKNNPPPQD
jgi:hypothetical protein